MKTTVYIVQNPRGVPSELPVFYRGSKPYYVGALLRGRELPPDVLERFERQGFVAVRAED